MSISAKSAASTPPAPARIVMTAVEQRADLELADRLLQAGQLLLGLRHGVGVVLLHAQLHQHLELVDAVVHPGDPLDLGVGARQAAGHLLGAVRVVPQVGGPGLLLELTDLGAQGVQIGDMPHRLHGRAQVLEL